MISTATVKRLLKEHCSDATVKSIARLGAGRQWEVFKVRWNGQWEWPNSVTFQHEVTVRVSTKPSSRDWVTSLERLPLVAPRELYAAQDDDFSIEVHEYVDGITVKESPGFAYLPDFAARLRQIHTHPLPYGKPPFAGDWWFDKVYATLEESISYVGEHSLTDLPVSILPRMLDFEPSRTSLLHGDLSDTNILLAPDEPARVAAIIDWDTAHYGDYLWDLANWATFNEGAPEIERLLQLYHGLPETDGFHRLLLRRFWVYFAVQATTKLAGLHRMGYTDLARGRARIALALGHL